MFIYFIADRLPLCSTFVLLRPTHHFCSDYAVDLYEHDERDL